jgi:hypothetical protein
MEGENVWIKKRKEEIDLRETYWKRERGRCESGRGDFEGSKYQWIISRKKVGKVVKNSWG